MSKGKETTTDTNSSFENTTKQPAWMTAGSQQAVGMASDIANRDYSGFGGQRIADISGNEQAGINAAFGEQGRYDSDFDKSRALMDGITSFTDEGVAEKYMNPWIENVLNVGVGNMDKSFMADKAELDRTAGMRGAFGGRRNVAENQLQESHNKNISDTWLTGMGQAWDAGAALHGDEQQQNLKRAGGYMDAAQSQSSIVGDNIRDMMMTGLTDRTQDQAGKDFEYLQFLEERDWDVGNLDVLVKTLQAVPHDITQSGTEESSQTVTEKADPLKTIVGVGMIAAAAVATGGASLANPAMWAALAPTAAG